MGVGSTPKNTMAAGTATCFITDTLPTDHNGVTVRQSRNGTYMPSVANGYLGTVIYSDTVHVSGVYNGKAYAKKNPIYPVYFKQHTHRARVPSTAAIDFSVSGIQGKTSYALDVQEAVFYKWFRAENLQVKQRIYAHQSRKNLLIVEIAARNTANREFLMSVSLNRGDASDDFQFQTIESNRTGASAAIAKVYIFFYIPKGNYYPICHSICVVIHVKNRDSSLAKFYLSR